MPTLESTQSKLKRRVNRQYTESTRKAHVAAWKSSDLSRIAYSGQHGLTPSVFNRWCRAASVGKETASFHPVKIESPHHARAMRAQGIEISFPNGIQIRGIRAEDGELLERLVRCI